MEKQNKKFRFLEHTADIKFQAFGSTLEECFENCGLALINSQYKGKIKILKTKKIKVKGKDKESLLYNFLEEILILLESGFITGKARVEIRENARGFNLEAGLIGDDINNYKDEISVDAKAITYNEMFIKFDEKTKTWTAQVVVDV